LNLSFDLVDAVANGRQLINAAIFLRPDVIVSDVSMPLMSDNQAMMELKFRGYTIPFVLISADVCGVDDYIKDGAIAFVAKIDMGSELAPAVASAYSGELYISQSAGTGHVRLADRLGPVHSPKNSCKQSSTLICSWTF
jgi:DNA-binding NarL/FixJ family response regulator